MTTRYDMANRGRWIPDGHDMSTVWTSARTLAMELDAIRDGGTVMDGTMTTPDRRTVRLDMTPDMATTLATILATADGYRVIYDTGRPDTEDDRR